MGLLRDLSDASRAQFDKYRNRPEYDKASRLAELRGQDDAYRKFNDNREKSQFDRKSKEDELRAQFDKYRNRPEYDKASRLAELRARNEKERAQYDKYSRPKAANVRRAPVKNAASDVGGSTSDELTLAQIAGQMESAFPSSRNAPPGLGQTDIVRGGSNQNYPVYNPQKGDIGIQGSFDPARIDSIVSGARDAVKGLGSQGAAIDAANDERDIAGVLGVLRDFGIGTGPDAMENLRAEREMDPVIDYNDQSLMNQRMANYAAMNAAASANSPSYEDLLATFGFSFGGSGDSKESNVFNSNYGPTPSPDYVSRPSVEMPKELKNQYTEFLGGNFVIPVMGPSPEQRVQPPGASSYPEGYGSALNAPPGSSFNMQVIDKDGDRIDDRYQAGPGQPRGNIGSNFVGPSPYMT
jgi:hypothetical protein